MLQETERDILHAFFISLVGFVLTRIFLWHVRLWPDGPHGIGVIAQYMLFPFVILIEMNLNRKTLLSFCFARLCFYTWFWTTCLMIWMFMIAYMTGKLHC